MTKGGEVGRTVPAERANPLLITPFPSFNESLSHLPQPFFLLSLYVWESSPESSLMVREEWKEGCAKVEQNPAEKTETSWKVVPCDSARSVRRKISRQTLKIMLFITKIRQAAPNQGFHPLFHFWHGLFLGFWRWCFTFYAPPLQ